MICDDRLIEPDDSMRYVCWERTAIRAAQEEGSDVVGYVRGEAMSGSIYAPGEEILVIQEVGCEDSEVRHLRFDRGWITVRPQQPEPQLEPDGLSSNGPAVDPEPGDESPLPAEALDLSDLSLGEIGLVEHAQSEADDSTGQ